MLVFLINIYFSLKMESKPLINSEKVIHLEKNNETSRKCYMIQYSILATILVLQIFTTTYLLLLGKYAQELDLFDFNKTDTDDYISKFKIIINQVCHSFVNCTY